jgi:hypothetical protein
VFRLQYPFRRVDAIEDLAPSRAAVVFYFACNMDQSGIKPFEASPTLNRCFARHAKDTPSYRLRRKTLKGLSKTSA